MTTRFDSFDRSALGAFIESKLGNRNLFELGFNVRKWTDNGTAKPSKSFTLDTYGGPLTATNMAVCELKDNKPLFVFVGPVSELRDGTIVTSDGGNLKMFSTDGTLLFTLEHCRVNGSGFNVCGTSSQIYDCVYDPSEEMFYTVGANVIRKWSMDGEEKTATEGKPFFNHGNSIRKIILADGDLFIGGMKSTTDNSTIRRLTTDGDVLWSITSGVNSSQISINGGYLAASDTVVNFELFDLDGEEIYSKGTSDLFIPKLFTVDSTGECFILAGDNKLKLLDTDGEELWESTENIFADLGLISSGGQMTLSGNRIIIASDDPNNAEYDFAAFTTSDGSLLWKTAHYTGGDNRSDKGCSDFAIFSDGSIWTCGGRKQPGDDE